MSNCAFRPFTSLLLIIWSVFTEKHLTETVQRLHLIVTSCTGVRAKKFFLGGGGYEFARLVPKAREPLGGSGSMLPRKILKNRVCFMPFPAFWCGFLCMEQVTNEKKILRILVKQNMNRKIARLLSKNCPTD